MTGDLDEVARAPHRWWFPFWIPLFAGILILTGMFHRPALTWWRNSQAVNLSRRGEKSLAAGDFREAGRALQVALRKAPENPDVVRLAARFCTRAGVPEALVYWEKLFSLVTPTDEDRRGYVQSAQSLGRLDRSGPVVQALLAAAPSARENQWLLLDQLLLIGNLEGAVSAARIGLQEDPRDPERVMTLARVLLATGQPGPSAEAARLLKSVAMGGPLKRAALKILVELDGLGREEEEWILKSLETLPDATLGDRLAALDVRMRLHPEQAEQGLSDTLGKAVREGLTDSDRLEWVGWLRARGRLSAADGLISKEMVQTNRVAAVAKLEILGQMGRWDELDRLATLGLETLDLDAVDCAAALAAMGRGNREEAARRLDTAAGRNQGRPEMLLDLARFAESVGQEETAILILLASLNRSGTEPLAAPQLLRLVRGRAARGIGSPNEAVRVERSVYDSLIRILGSDPVVLAQWCYLNALLGENLEETARRMERLVAEKPSERPFQAVLALVHLQRNRTEEALKAIEASGTDWSAEEPRWRAVYAAILRANHLQDRARRVVEGVDPARLRPIEIQLAGLQAPRNAR